MIASMYSVAGVMQERMLANSVQYMQKIHPYHTIFFMMERVGHKCTIAREQQWLHSYTEIALN